MPKDECYCCGGEYLWHWEEAFCKFGFRDGDGQVETGQVEDVLIDAGYSVESCQWGLHNTVILSIKKDGTELMPSAESGMIVGYDNPRKYLPQGIIDLLDDKLPAEGAEAPF